MKILVQMDPLSSLNEATDSTLVIVRAAEARGAQVAYYEPKYLSYIDGEVVANCKDFSDAELGVKNLKDYDAPSPAVRHELHHGHVFFRFNKRRCFGAEQPERAQK